MALRFYDDLAFAEIAAVLECTESTARSYVHRALERLRAQLRESNDDERDERALRQALQDLGSDDPVDLGQVRRRAAERRRNGRTVAGLAVALVLVAGVVGLPRLMVGGGDQPTSAAGGAQVGPEADSRSDSGPAAESEAAPPDGRVAPSPTEPAPDGWRTEYYRDISFQVPAAWGYAVPPSPTGAPTSPAGNRGPTSAGPTSGWPATSRFGASAARPGRRRC